MDWQVEKEHDAFCVAVHEKYGDPIKASAELRCLYAELLERVAVARRAEAEDRQMTAIVLGE